MTAIRIAGTITLPNGETVEFTIGESGYQQWGNVDSVLWQTVPIVNAIQQILLIEEFADEDENDDQGNGTENYTGPTFLEYED